MKTKIYILIVLFTSTIFAQNGDFTCISNFDTNPDPTGVYSYATSFNKSSSTNPPMVFNIKFWDLRLDDGSSNTIITETDALQAVANLNIAYNEYNIYFKYRGFEYVDDSIAYNENGLGGMRDRLIELGLDTLKSLNVILSDITTMATGFNPGSYCQVPKVHITKWVTIHEIGHNLGLGHTFEKYNIPAYSACEHVTRDPNNVCDPEHPEIPCFNATTHGDRIVDTAAISSTTNANNYDYNICDYTQQGYDCQGEEYDLQEVDLLNFMNINAPNDVYTCRTMFSIGQGVRMRETILSRPDIFVQVSTTVSALYKPYDGEYSSNGVSTYSGIKFQPGFDYDFLSCYPNGAYSIPAAYNDTSFTYLEGGLWAYSFSKDITPDYFYTIVHKDRFAVRIEQLDEVQPRKCWNTGQGAIGGTLILFNDGVLNTNVTITSQDSTSINNPQLIDNLPSGLYNVIKVYYSSGSEETLILKENN
jgi:hypothetical protein